MSFFKEESGLAWWQAPGIVQYSTDFAMARYHDELYRRHGIPRPSALAGAVPKRRAEFLAGRYCAARVLERLQRETAVGVGPNRSPVWPESVVGSISHTADKAVAVATQASGIIGLGIDIETVFDTATTQELRLQVLNPEDEQWLCHPQMSAEEALTLMFSAKESLFKALYPSVGEYFGLEAANVAALDHERQQIHLVLKCPLGRNLWPIGTRFVAEYRRPAINTVATVVIVTNREFQQ